MIEQRDIYQLTEDQEQQLWKNAFFVFDTSPLLNMYKFSESTIKELDEKIFQRISQKIHLPFQVFLEFNKNHRKQLNETIQEYDEIKKKGIEILNQLQQVSNKIKKSDKHPILKIEGLEKILENYSAALPNWEKEINDKVKLINNKIYDSVKELMDDHFILNKPFTYTEKIRIAKEGEFRYKNQIPPGYKDDHKIGFQKFGDLIVWKEILKLSKDYSKSIIFIVDDLKEDWWVLNKNHKAIRERDELQEELYEASGQLLKMYNLEDFLEASNKFLKTKVSNEIIERAKIPLDFGIIKANAVDITATNQKTEPSRIERLNRVVNYYLTHADENKLNLKALNDHKGELTAIWSNNPSNMEIGIIEQAWENECEPKENVNHKIAGDNQ